MKELEAKLQAASSLIGKRRISRRDFVQLAMAAGIAAPAASAFYTQTARAEPKKGGLARIGLAHGATTDSLDPGLWPDTFTQVAFSGSVCNSLTEVDASGNISGDLAEGFEAADGSTKWVFRLRKGLTFHNGKPVTATDVVESFRHHMGETRSAAKSLLASVTDIKADGNETVIFTLNGPSADFPYIASDYHIPIMPAKAGGGMDWQAGIGTGAFILEKFEPGVQAKLKRNPNYHKENRPYFDEALILALTDVTARTNALLTGDVDWIGRCDLKTLDMLQSNPELEIDEVTGYGHYTLPMNCTIAPFDNPDVRNALKYALNREEIVEKIFLGHATVGNDNPIAPSIKFAVDPQPKHGYDPEMAKSLLKKAGMENLKVDLSVANAAFAGAIDMALLYKEQAAKAGIDINIIREPEDAYWDNVWLKKPWCASYWSGRATCDWMFSTTYAEGAAWNESFWSNKRFNELLVAARGETDDAKRAPMYAEMQQLVHDDSGAIVLVFNNYVSAHTKKLAHGAIAPNWEVDGLRLTERWWFDS